MMIGTLQSICEQGPGIVISCKQQPVQIGWCLGRVTIKYSQFPKGMVTMSERRESQRQDVGTGKLLFALIMFITLLLTLFINPTDPLLAAPSGMACDHVPLSPDE